jgi:hypothetical protein
MKMTTIQSTAKEKAKELLKDIPCVSVSESIGVGFSTSGQIAHSPERVCVFFRTKAFNPSSPDVTIEERRTERKVWYEHRTRLRDETMERVKAILTANGMQFRQVESDQIEIA